MIVDLSDEDIETLYQNCKDLDAMHYAFDYMFDKAPKVTQWLAKFKMLVDRIEQER